MPASCELMRGGGAVPDLILDTDVLIEVLRDQDGVIEWLKSIGSLEIGISVLTRMELVQGAQNRKEQELIIAELERYQVVHLALTDSERAMRWFEKHYLSHGVEIIDCMIAASAVRLDLPLYTFNQKHYRVLPKLNLQQPYAV